MGAKASKPAQSATRKFPVRAPGGAAFPPPPPPPPRSSRPSAPPASSPAARGSAPRASPAKDDAIKADGTDPDPDPLTNPAFSQRLRQMGVATPNPTLSTSSTASERRPDFPPPPSAQQQNRTLGALEARQRLQERAALEFENLARGQGREFLDVATLKQILVLRAGGTAPADIERRLRLKGGVVERLGPQGVTLPLSSG